MNVQRVALNPEPTMAACLHNSGKLVTARNNHHLLVGGFRITWDTVHLYMSRTVLKRVINM
jgi:hypothetical protein